MNWQWVSSLDGFWRSPGFPMWLTLAAAVVFGAILFVTLFRAERSVANGALTVITLLAIGIAVAATIRSYTPVSSRPSLSDGRSPTPVVASLPALSCIDDLAGEPVQLACEKALFGSPEAAATAVVYTAAQISRLAALGEAAGGNIAPELKALRRALQRDRYGLVAQALVTRDHCTSSDCAAFRFLPERQQIVANMDAHVYDGLVSRYATSWNAPAAAATTPMAALTSGLPASLPTGRPTNAEFPSASSTPAVSIMSAEPPAPRSTATAPANSPARSAGQGAEKTAAAPAPKKPPKPRAAAPTQLAPPPSSTAPAEPAGAAND